MFNLDVQCEVAMHRLRLHNDNLATLAHALVAQKFRMARVAWNLQELQVLTHFLADTGQLHSDAKVSIIAPHNARVGVPCTIDVKDGAEPFPDQT